MNEEKKEVVETLKTALGYAKESENAQNVVVFIYEGEEGVHMLEANEIGTPTIIGSMEIFKHSVIAASLDNSEPLEDETKVFSGTA